MSSRESLKFCYAKNNENNEEIEFGPKLNIGHFHYFRISGLTSPIQPIQFFVKNTVNLSIYQFSVRCLQSLIQVVQIMLKSFHLKREESHV